MNEKPLDLSDSWVHLDPAQVKKILKQYSALFRPGKPIRPEEFAALPAVPELLDYAKARNVLNHDEAKYQMGQYMMQITPARKPFFFSVLSEGVLYSIDQGLGYYANPKEKEEKNIPREETIFYRRFMCTEKKFAVYENLGIGDLLARCRQATVIEQMLGRDIYIALRLAIDKKQPDKKPVGEESRSAKFVVQPILRQMPPVGVSQNPPKPATAAQSPRCARCDTPEASLPDSQKLDASEHCPACAKERRLENSQSKLSSVFQDCHSSVDVP